jgi:hypothetical protein
MALISVYHPREELVHGQVCRDTPYTGDSNVDHFRGEKADFPNGQGSSSGNRLLLAKSFTAIGACGIDRIV